MPTPDAIYRIDSATTTAKVMYAAAFRRSSRLIASPTFCPAFGNHRNRLPECQQFQGHKRCTRAA